MFFPFVLCWLQGHVTSYSWAEGSSLWWTASGHQGHQSLCVLKFHGEKLLPQEGIGCSSEGSSDPEQDAPDAPPPMEVETCLC